MKVTLALAMVILVIAVSAKAESKRREHHAPAPHETKEYIKSFKSGRPEKKGKPFHHHKGYLHDDKHEHRNIKHPIEIPPHEGHAQSDIRSLKKSKDIKGHDAWHKKDMHLQDLGFERPKTHHDTQHESRSHKVHHTWPHHNSEALVGKHETTHHKGSKSEEHHPHKSLSEKHHSAASARAMTKSLHHAVHSQPAPKKSHNLNKPEHGWGKNKKQKKAIEKQKKQKLHRKKQFKGELQKLW